ncbi:MAG: peptidoglycan-binding domain-containing protein [Hyphomicrobiaceae bacterium]
MTMLAAHQRLSLFVCAALFLGVAANAFLLQGARTPKVASPGPVLEPAASAPLATPAGSTATDASSSFVEDIRATLDRIAPGGSGETASAEGASGRALLPADNRFEGDTDPQVVRAIQRELTARGYDPGTVDGMAGLQTRAAILAYEHDERMVPTAEPSEALLRTIVLGVSQAPLAGGPGEHPAARKVEATIRRLMTGLGYDPGPEGPDAGLAFAEAIRRLETDLGLAGTGRISGRLVVALVARVGAKARLADAGVPE